MPSVTFLVPDVSGPVLGPVTVLARHLEPLHPVQIVGPDFGAGICPMYGGAFDYKVVSTPRMYRLPEYFRERKRLEEAITGDIIFSVKAVGDTLPVALNVRKARGARVVVYLDEWDGALMAACSPRERLQRWATQWHHPLDEVYYPWVERLIPRADRVTSTSTFLQSRFGGEVLPMGVDTDFFVPAPDEDRARLREELGLAGQTVVVFGGVVRPHKGLEDLLEALVLLGNPRLTLLVVGPETEHLRSLRADARFSSYLASTGARPKAEMPLYLSLADVIALPLADTLLARSQVPCKVFEAMAMSKPVVATDVSDLRAIIGDGGWVVPPGDTRALSLILARVVSDPGEALERGRRARQRCLEHYSHKQSREQLLRIVNDLGPGDET